ncbi:MAG: hypothetical protein V4580_09495 [Bacteroidota bacterium]
MFNKVKDLLWRRKYIFLFLGLFIVVLTQRFLNERQNGLINSVSSDGLGYYCYLPATILYQDFTYSYYDKPENRIRPFYKPYISPYKDNTGFNKYYCGTSVCLLPFFIAGVVISAIAGTDINGYTDTFLMLVSVAAIFYYLLSVFLILKIARFFAISEKISFITCLLFFLATNMFHYVIQEPSMSHAYSFFGVTLFLYCYMRLHEHITTKNMVFLGLSLALVALIRPVNVVVILFTPFFSQNFREYLFFLKNIFTNHLKGVFLFVLAVGCGIGLQFMFYYFQTGYFFIVSYEGEAFDFSKPEIFNVLFSYRKGIFIYAPILLFAIIFMIFAKNNWFKKTIFLVTMSVFTYITASWWCWWYGGGLSIRPMVDFFPLFIVITMLLLDRLTMRSKRIVLMLTLPFLFYSQLMSFQYSNMLIDSSDMDKEKFWNAFLEVDLATINKKRIHKILESRAVHKTELLNYEDEGADERIAAGGFNSNKACIVGKKNNYSKGFGFPVKDLKLGDSFYVIVECMAKTSKDGKDLGLVISIDENPNIIKWDVVYKNQFEEGPDGWTKMTHVQEIDVKYINEKNYMKIFANTSKGENLVDDFKYTIVKK